MIFIQFTDVGREKRSWIKSFDEAPEDDRLLTMIEREARHGARIASASLDAEWDKPHESGVLSVGGFRIIGTFRLLTETERDAADMAAMKTLP